MSKESFDKESSKKAISEKVSVEKASFEKVRVLRKSNCSSRNETDDHELLDNVIIEEPLSISLQYTDHNNNSTDVITEELMITMRTPGDDKHLIQGILYSEGIVQNREDIVDIMFEATNKGRHDVKNSALVILNDNHQLNMSQLYRNFVVNSACGVCGKGTINALEIAHEPEINREQPMVEGSLICKLPNLLKSTQPLFEKTGGVHASALISTKGVVQYVAEDVGRHNAFDKVVGAIKDQFDLNDHLIFCSGRLSYELVQKSIMAGIGFVVGIGAPSSLAIDLAKRFDLTLVGFIKKDSYNIYSGEWRFK